MERDKLTTITEGGTENKGGNQNFKLNYQSVTDGIPLVNCYGMVDELCIYPGMIAK